MSARTRAPAGAERIRLVLRPPTSASGHPIVCCILAIALAPSISAQEPSKRSEALDRAIEQLAQERPPQVAESRPTAPPPSVASPTVRLLDISLDGMFTVGTSTAGDDEIRRLEAGGHDPQRRGFTVNQVELSLAGAVDPYLNAEAHIVYFTDAETGASEFELEEAFATTQQLPFGLQAKLGHFLTELGRHNPMHPHAWDWVDAPVIHTRVLGPDGMRGTGARLSWLAPTSFFSELTVGVQNGTGETMTSFGSSEEAFTDRPVGGRLFEPRETKSFVDMAWHARGSANLDVGDAWNLNLGASAAYGGNATGSDSDTLVWGADAVLRWRPADHFRGWPFVKLTGELLARRYEAGAQIDPNDPLVTGDEVALPEATLRDLGFYVQGLYGFSYGWAAGLRWEMATASGGDTYSVANHAFGPRSEDPYRDDRLRIAPLLVWQPSEFSRIRAQYDYDHADHLPSDEAHSFWITFEFLIGAHPVHAY